MDLLLFFTIYSFSGWLLETIFASIYYRRFINRGFLSGSFCPLYGFSAVLVVLSSKLVSTVFQNSIPSLVISIVLAVILVTALEYFTGYVLEKIFSCKWWDYTHNFANIDGYICLKYSVLWGLLALMLLRVVHPEISELVFAIPASIKRHLATLLFLYFLADTARSVINVLDLREAVLNYSNFPVNKYHQIILLYKRFFLAFPRLLILNAGIINRDIRSILNDRFDKIKVELKSKFL